MTGTNPPGYDRAWRQRLNRWLCERPSNAQHHCKSCGVELRRGVDSCTVCTRLKKAGRV